MKPIKLAILFLCSWLLFSCAEVNLVRVAINLLPESDDTYCDKPNPDTSYDQLIWESIISSDSSSVYNTSKPLIYKNQVILNRGKKYLLSFHVFEKDNGQLILERESTKINAILKRKRYNTGSSTSPLKAFGDQVYLVLDCGVKALFGLPNLEVKWSENIDCSFDYKNGVYLANSHYSVDDYILRLTDVATGFQKSWDELPRTCAPLTNKLNIDPETNILYLTDKKRLYAMQLP